jgi:hypothetical protein
MLTYADEQVDKYGRLLERQRRYEALRHTAMRPSGILL